MTTELSPAVIEALSLGMLPDVQWKPQDDLCDCTYQRIGMWTNPYLAETLEVRMCCIWAKLYAQYPEFVRLVPAFWDYNQEQWVTEPAEWNGEDDMPQAIYNRQVARQTGKSLAEVREMGLLAPKGKPRQEKPIVLLPWSGEWVPVELGV